jgi:hypothetical protein
MDHISRLTKTYDLEDIEKLKTTDHLNSCKFTKMTKNVATTVKCIIKKLFLMKPLIFFVRRNFLGKILFQVENAIVVVTLLANHCSVVLWAYYHTQSNFLNVGRSRLKYDKTQNCNGSRVKISK